MALTGQRAEQQAIETTQALAQTAKTLECAPAQVPTAVAALITRQRSLKKQLSSGQPGGETTNDKLPPATAELAYQQAKSALAEAARLLSVAPLAVPERVELLCAEVESIQQQLAQRDAAGPLSADKLLESAETVGKTIVVVAETPGAPQNLMRQLIDQLRQKQPSVAVLLAASEGDDKVTLIAGISKDLEAAGASAGKWIGPVAKAIGGGGGGRADMAQAGGKQPEKLPEALEIARRTIAKMLG